MKRNLLKKLLAPVIILWLLSICFSLSSKAQTILTAGDIAIIGFNTDLTPDDIVIVTLKNLSAGTVFYVNDNEVLTAGGTSFAELNEAEASFTVKAGQTIAAGTVMVLPWGGGLTSTTQYDWSVTAGAGLGNGEEIYIYNASSITATIPGSFIFGATQGSNTGLIPAGLVNNQSWIDLGSSRAYRYKLSGATYTGTQAALLAAIGNPANWEAAGTYTFAPGNWTFNVTGAAPNPTVNLSVSSNTGSEAAATSVTVTVTASAAVSGNQTVSIGVSGTGITATDYTLSNNTITIISGATTGTATFTILNDTDVEPTETATLSISNPSAGISIGGISSQNIAITDNDVAASPLMRITEYMYGGANGEFVEFTNTGSGAIDMTGWSFDDADRAPGAQSLSIFGNVQPGESVILTEAVAATFRTAWNLCSGIKIIGGLTNNLGRADEINLYDANNNLVDRLTYDDQTLGGVRTQNKSGWVNAAGLGNNLPAQWALSANGDAEGSYASSGADIGSPGKSSRATVAYNPCPVVNGAPVISFNTSTTNYIDAGVTISPASPFAVSGVINDPTDPVRFSGIDFTISDDATPVTELTVTVNSSNISVVPLANINLTGTGSNRNVKIIPASNGYSVITVSVNDGATTSSYTINYAASVASLHATTTRFHTGASDASTAVMVDTDYMLVADDENQVIRLYNRHNSGLPVTGFDFNSSLGLTDISGGIPREVDIESSVKSGNRIYWLASHGNSSSGALRPNRYRLFATDITGSGTSVALSYVGRYDNLRTNLINWDVNNVHGLGTNFFGLSAGAASGKIPEEPDGSGFNIEGIVIAPDGITAYICFRAPISPANNRTKALIVPVTNLAALVSGNPSAGSAVFGSPIQLDLGGRGIREIKQVAAGQYLIIAGPHGEASGIAPADFRLYTWTGNANNAPIQLSTDLTSLNSNGSFESIVDVPAPLTEGSQVQLLVDNGDAVYYNDGTIAKELPENNLKKFRSEIVTLTGICIPSTSNTTITACDNFTWNGTTYIASGIYTFATTNAAGCDSIATLTLAINHSTTSSTSITACGSYTWNNTVYTASGTYTFTAVNTVGCDSTATLLLTVNSIPAMPSAVSGPVNVCPYVGSAQQLIYTVPPVSTATSYIWTVPPTVSIVTGQGTASITVTINSGFIASANKLIKVRAVSGCGTSAERFLYLVAQLPGTPGQVSGPTNTCPFLGTATSAVYSIRAVPGASSYIWTAQAGTTIISHPNGNGVNDTTVNVSFEPGFTTSSIAVQSVNDCGTSAARSLLAARNLPSTPGLISGPVNACPYMAPAGVAATYSIAPLPGAISYTWTAPAGSVISHPNGIGANDHTVSVVFPASFTNGNITVSATSGCGTGTARSLTIGKLNPATPGAIDVIQTAVCPDREYSYTLAAMPANATSIQWEVPTGAGILSGQGTTTITVSYPSTAVSGLVTARAISNCAISSMRQVAIKLPACPPPAVPFSRINTNSKFPVQETVANMKILIFPSPSVSDFSMQVLHAGKEMITVRILDIQGRELKKIPVNPYATVNFGSELRPGTYLAEIMQGKNKQVLKLLKR